MQDHGSIQNFSSDDIVRTVQLHHSEYHVRIAFDAGGVERFMTRHVACIYDITQSAYSRGRLLACSQEYVGTQLPGQRHGQVEAKVG